MTQRAGDDLSWSSTQAGLTFLNSFQSETPSEICLWTVNALRDYVVISYAVLVNFCFHILVVYFMFNVCVGMTIVFLVTLV